MRKNYIRHKLHCNQDFNIFKNVQLIVNPWFFPVTLIYFNLFKIYRVPLEEKQYRNQPHRFSSLGSQCQVIKSESQDH